jgi:hypothetical protein
VNKLGQHAIWNLGERQGCVNTTNTLLDSPDLTHYVRNVLAAGNSVEGDVEFQEVAADDIKLTVHEESTDT